MGLADDLFLHVLQASGELPLLEILGTFSLAVGAAVSENSNMFYQEGRFCLPI